MVNFLWDNIFRRTKANTNISTLLRENILFQDLSMRELRFLENIVHLRHYHAGESVFRQGEIGTGMYMVVKGSVDIVMSDSQRSEQQQELDNRDLFVTKLVVGDFFGELSLVEHNGPRSATARAHEDLELIGFFKPDLLQVLERSPTTGVKVLFRLAEVLGKRLKETTDKISQMRKELRMLRHQRFPRAQGERTSNESDPTSSTP